MKCNKCGAELIKSDFCPECKADVSFYKKAARASNVYYNKGLEQAGVRDLSGAIESLKMSVLLDKTNVPARNLLGLCFYETGEVVEALSCWIISKNFNSVNNPAVEYVDIVRKKKTDFDDKCAAARKYNRVLENALNENYDIALIQLKKVVSQCPGLLKAQLLLALFYIEKRAYSRAEKCLRAVLKVDAGNVTANRYLKEIGKTSEPADKKPAALPSFLMKDDETKEEKNERSPLNGNDVIIPETGYKKSNTGVFSLMNILIGIGIGAALIFLLVVPARDSLRASGNDASLEENNKILSEANDRAESAEKKVEELTAKVDELQGQLDNEGNSYYEVLNLAAADYISDNRVACAEKIALLDAGKIPENAKGIYDTLVSETMRSSAGTIYSKAEEMYDEGNFKESAKEFEIAYACYGNDNEDAAYYTARSYERNDDTENALKWYKVIVEKYSDGEYIGEARDYIAENES